MRHLLIGGAGLVGSHVAKRVGGVVVDDLSRGDRRNVSGDFLQACVTEYSLIRALIQSCDRVFFFAALPVLDCDRNPAKASEVMITGLMNVAVACRQYGKRLIYSSSGSVYGANPYAKESDPLLGDTLYAKLKIEAERMLTAVAPDFVGLRYQSVYGNAHQSGYKAVIQKFREHAGKLPVYGDGTQSYDFIHVDDVAQANVLAMTKGQGFYNVATGRKTSILKLAQMMGEYEFVDGYTPIAEMCGCPEKAEKELGFVATRQLEDYLCAA